MKRLLFVLVLVGGLCACSDKPDPQGAFLDAGYTLVEAFGGDAFLGIYASFTELEEAITDTGNGNMSVDISEYLFGVKGVSEGGFTPSPTYASKIENLAIGLNPGFKGNSTGRHYLYGKNKDIEGLPSVAVSEKIFAEVLRAYDNDTLAVRRNCMYAYAYAGVGSIRIKANKPLFGIEAGGDLSAHFRMIYSPELLVAFPSCDILRKCGEANPEELNDWKGTLVNWRDMVVKIKEAPAEKYDEITFVVEMDIQLPDNEIQTISNSVAVEFEN
ncbi:MAG: hypothetical protein IIX00_04935 [Tidjanibacter sp.]|nr:hypothetical protein [Tidjanibacter sp.]